ncbi:EIF-2-alpha kinase GCN2 isoform X1 [Tanacetum coccineum]
MAMTLHERKATMDIITRFFHPESCDIHLNHGDLLEAIWSWIGIKADHRQKVAELLSLLGSLRPQSTERKSMWVELNITEGVVDKLQNVGSRFCGIADHALPKLRGALQGCIDTLAMKALDELSQILMYLRIWKIDKNVFIDPLIPPTEGYYRDSFFQIYLRKYNSVGTPTEGALLAVGGRYDYLLHQMWQSEYKSNPPGAVGTSLALETIIQHSSIDICRPFRNESSKSVLVCSRGGGGLLEKRMELAEFVPVVDPSPKEQYDYAKEHDIKCQIEMSEGSVKIRHLELKREKEVSRESVVKSFSEAMASQSLLQIQGVLTDASQKEITNQSVKRWPNDLQHLAYDIDDILDDLATEAMHRELNNEPESHTSTCFTMFPLRSNMMMDKLNDITTKLEDLVEERL